MMTTYPNFFNICMYKLQLVAVKKEAVFFIIEFKVVLLN